MAGTQSDDLNASYVTEDEVADNETTPAPPRRNPSPEQGGATLGTGGGSRPPGESPYRNTQNPLSTNPTDGAARPQRFDRHRRALAPRVHYRESVNDRLQSRMEDAVTNPLPYEPYAESSPYGAHYNSSSGQTAIPYGPRQPVRDSYAGYTEPNLSQMNHFQSSGAIPPIPPQLPNINQSYQSRPSWAQTTSNHSHAVPTSQYINGTQSNRGQRAPQQPSTSTSRQNSTEAYTTDSMSRTEMERIAKELLDKEFAKSKKTENEKEASYAKRWIEADRQHIESNLKTKFEADLQSELVRRERKMARDRDRQLELDRGRITAELKAEFDMNMKLRDQTEEYLHLQLGEAGEQRSRLEAELAEMKMRLDAHSESQAAKTAESSAALTLLENKLSISEEKIMEERHKKTEVESHRDTLQSRLSISEEMFMSEVDKCGRAEKECELLRANLSLSEMRLKSEVDQRSEVEKERDDLKSELSLAEHKLALETDQKQSTERQRTALQNEISLLEGRLISETGEKDRTEAECNELKKKILELEETFASEIEQKAKEAADLEQRLEKDNALALSKLTDIFQKQLDEIKGNVENNLAADSKLKISELQEGLLTMAKHLASESEQKEITQDQLNQLNNTMAYWYQNTSPLPRRALYNRFEEAYEHDRNSAYQDGEAQRIEEVANPNHDSRRRVKRRERYYYPSSGSWHPSPPLYQVPDAPSQYNRSSETGESETSINDHYWDNSQLRSPKQRVTEDEKRRLPEVVREDRNYANYDNRSGRYVYMTPVSLRQTTSGSDVELPSDGSDSELEQKNAESAQRTRRSQRTHKSSQRMSSKNFDKDMREDTSWVSIPGGPDDEEGAKLTSDKDAPEQDPATQMRSGVQESNVVRRPSNSGQKPGPATSRRHSSSAATPKHTLQVPSKVSSTTSGSKTPQAAQSESRSSRRGIGSPLSSPAQDQRALVETEPKVESDDEEEDGWPLYWRRERTPRNLLPAGDQFGRPIYLVPNPHSRRARLTRSGRRVEEDEYGMMYGFKTQHGFVPLTRVPFGEQIVEKIPMRRA